MSLLTTASPWTNDDSQQNKKRTSTMRNTIKNIQPYAPSDSNQEINENNLNVEKSDWSSHLNFSIAYFERIEDYETCIEINNILKGL